MSGVEARLTDEERARLQGTWSDPDAFGSVLPMAMERAVERIVAGRLDRVRALADDIEWQSRVCNVGNTATIANRLRAALDGEQ